MTAPRQGCGLDLACQAGQAATTAFQDMIRDVARGAAELVVTTSTWWVETDSINPNDPAVIAAQGATRPLILIVLVGSVLVQAIRLILSRKGEPLVLVATGLIRYAVTAALGLTALQGALLAGDALATDLLDGAAANFAVLMQGVLVDGDATFPVLLVSLIAAVLSLVQWVLMAMRQAGLLVLAAMLPLAAAGSLNRSTRGWLDRLLVWLIAIVAYKPAAAFVYYLGFSYLSSPAAGGGIATMITGLMVLLLAVITLPVLLKFFAWSGTQIGGGGGNGSGFLGAAGAIAMTQGYGRGAVDRAQALDTNGPGSYATFGSYTSPAGAAPATATSGRGAAAGAGGVGGAAVAGVAAGVEGARAAGHQITGGGTST